MATTFLSSAQALQEEQNFRAAIANALVKVTGESQHPQTRVIKLSLKDATEDNNWVDVVLEMEGKLVEAYPKFQFLTDIEKWNNSHLMTVENFVNTCCEQYWVRRLSC